MNKEAWKISEPTDIQLLKMKQNILRKKRKRQQILVSATCVFLCFGTFVFMKSNETEMIVKDNKLLKDSIVFDYEKTELESLPSKFEVQTSYCVEAFRLDMLKDVVLSVKGKVVNSKIVNGYQVIQMKISHTFYQENKVKENEIIEIWLPIYSDSSLNDLVYPFYEKGVYYVNLKIVDHHYQLVYPYDEHIEETKNGIKLFPKTWKELKNDKTYTVEGDKRWSRWDKEFDVDYKKLIIKYKGDQL